MIIEDFVRIITFKGNCSSCNKNPNYKVEIYTDDLGAVHKIKKCERPVPHRDCRVGFCTLGIFWIPFLPLSLFIETLYLGLTRKGG